MSDPYVRVDTRDLEKELEKFGVRARHLRDVNMQLAEIMKLYVEDNFETQSSFVGGAWDELSDLTLSMRRSSSNPKLLQDSGILVGSINADAENDWAEVYTNVPYAKYHLEGADDVVPIGHQAGSWELPKRDFFDIDLDAATTRAAEELAAEVGMQR